MYSISSDKHFHNDFNYEIRLYGHDEKINVCLKPARCTVAAKLTIKKSQVSNITECNVVTLYTHRINNRFGSSAIPFVIRSTIGLLSDSYASC